MTLSPGKIINLIAAILGAAGTIVLFKGELRLRIARRICVTRSGKHGAGAEFRLTFRG